MIRQPPEHGGRLLAGAIALYAILTGCGSTAQQDVDHAIETTPQEAAELPRQEDAPKQFESAAPSPLAVESPQASGSASEPASPRESPPVDSTGSEARPPAREDASQPLVGRGVTEDEIHLGIELIDGTDAAYDTIGAQGIARGNTRLQAQAIVEHINAHGGMVGRKIVPIYHSTDDRRGTFSVQAQQTCATFTQDNEVFAAVSQGRGGLELIACMAQADTPLVLDWNYFFDEQIYASFGSHFYQPSGLSGSRWGVYVDELVARGFFALDADHPLANLGPRIGILRHDTPSHERVSNQVVHPRLAAHGFTVEEEIAIARPGSTGEVGGMSAQISSAVLRFNQQNITHIIFLATESSGPFLFMPAAEAQRYRPRYALTTNDNPQLGVSNAPREQLRGAMGVGWWPTNDVAATEDPGGRPAYDRCLAIMAEAGMAPNDRGGEKSMLLMCEQLFFLRDALAHVEAFDAAGLRRAVDRLGDTFASPMTFGTRFAPGRSDGVLGVRPFAYFDDCECFKYIGELRVAS